MGTSMSAFVRPDCAAVVRFLTASPLARASRLCVISLSLLTAACISSYSRDDVDAGPNAVEKTLNPEEGGVIELTNGPKLTFPPGALPAGGDIVIRVTLSNMEPPPGAATPVWQFDPSGTTFSMPVPIELPFELGDRDPNKYTIAWTKAGDDTVFEDLPTTFSEDKAIATVDHFSFGIVREKQLLTCDESVSTPLDTDGDDRADICECNAGYLDMGGSCVDIDECATDNGGCDSHVACTNTPGGHICGKCPAGFSGLGTAADGCVDIDECQTGEAGCSSGVECTNTAGKTTAAVIRSRAAKTSTVGAAAATAPRATRAPARTVASISTSARKTTAAATRMSSAPTPGAATAAVTVRVATRASARSRAKTSTNARRTTAAVIR